MPGHDSDLRSHGSQGYVKRIIVGLLVSGASRPFLRGREGPHIVPQNQHLLPLPLAPPVFEDQGYVAVFVSVGILVHVRPVGRPCVDLFSRSRLAHPESSDSIFGGVQEHLYVRWLTRVEVCQRGPQLF